MKEIITHLTFDGNCRDAVTFYQKCLGAELQVMTFAETPCNVPAEEKGRVAHARLSKGAAVIMASDNLPGLPLRQGNNFSVALTCESLEEIERLFAALGEKGKLTMALADVFWGARFGMLTDQFGINWMFNWEKPKRQ